VRSKSWAIGCLLLIGLVIGLGVAVWRSGGGSDPGAAKDERYRHLLECELSIRRDIENPDAAVFPNYLTTPNAYHAQEAGDMLTETFDYRAKSASGEMQPRQGKCTYRREFGGSWVLTTSKSG
jgi:hypothetical protein